MRTHPFFVLAVLLVLGLWTHAARAQRVDGAVGLGGQLGEPSGITLKFYRTDNPSYDVLAAWDLDDFFFLNVHAEFAQPIEAENVEGLEWFIGPGAFLGIDDRPRDDEASFGISGRVGLNFVFAEHFELFGQITPRIALIPDTDGDVGGGAGLRYYF